MRSFSNYMQNKNLNALASEVAIKMVEANVDPWDFLIEYYKDDVRIVVALEAHKEETLNEDFWGGLKRMGKSLWGGVQSAGRELGQAAKAAGTGIARGAQTVRAGIMGPEAHYAASLEALQGLAKELNKNQAVQNAMNDPQVGGNYKKLVGDLQGILKQLDQQKPLINDLLKFQPGQGEYSAGKDSIGANPQAQVAGAKTPPPLPMSMGDKMAAGAYYPPQSKPFQPSGKILNTSGQPITAANYGT